MSITTSIWKTRAIFPASGLAPGPAHSPALIRVWRCTGPGCPLTSIWIPAVPNTPTGGPVQ